MIATDGQRSRRGGGACDRSATHPSVSLDEADARFRHLGALRRALGTNGKQASVIWAGVRGSRRAWRTCAFCESARQHAGVGWTLAALAFAQKRRRAFAAPYRSNQQSQGCGPGLDRDTPWAVVCAQRGPLEGARPWSTSRSLSPGRVSRCGTEGGRFGSTFHWPRTT